MRQEVAVLGGSGFVGRAVVSELRAQGIEARALSAPRLRFSPTQVRRPGGVPTGEHRDVVETVARQVKGADVVVNAAGVSSAVVQASQELYGANTLLPLLVARACSVAGVNRFIHLSTAAVQGSGRLDETERTAPFSPYSESKALAERLLLREAAVEQVIFRPTSVHGPDRAMTRSLIRLARSGVSSVAGAGVEPTPQVLVEDVAAAVRHLIVGGSAPRPRIVLQPRTGMTTGLLLRLLGGREPTHLPFPVAHAVLGAVRALGPLSNRLRVQARRLELLWFGQRQVPGWLATNGLVSAVDRAAWERLPLRVCSTRDGPAHRAANFLDTTTTNRSSREPSCAEHRKGGSFG
jgi:UDP-glucose 4-epimerase